MVLTTMLLLIVVGLAIAHDLLFFEGIFIVVGRHVDSITLVSSDLFFFHLVCGEALNVVLLMRHLYLLIAAVISEFEFVLAAVYVLNIFEISTIVEITTRQPFSAFFFLLLLWLISVSASDILLVAQLDLESTWSNTALRSVLVLRTFYCSLSYRRFAEVNQFVLLVCK